MELDEATLFNQFLEETNRSRRTFLQRLEEKYVKNQDESDIIDLDTLTIRKSKGHLQKMKDPAEFGTITSYSCRKGKNILRILKRKVKIRRKTRLIVYDNNEDSSYGIQNSSFQCLKECAVKLDLNSYHISRCNYGTIKNKTLNRPPELNTSLDSLNIVSSKSKAEKKFLVKTSPHLTLKQKQYFPLITSNISICGLSIRQHQSKLRYPTISPDIKKSEFSKKHLEMELEEELSFTEEITSDGKNIDDCNFRTLNSYNSLPVMKRCRNDIIVPKNREINLSMNLEKVDFSGDKFYNNKINYSDFGKLGLYERNLSSKKSLVPSRKIFNSSPPLQNCWITPLPSPAISKFTHSFKTVSRKNSLQIDIINLTKDCERNSKKNSATSDICLKNGYNRYQSDII